MDFNAVAMFVEVVNEGSFTKASKKLEIPTSTLSEKVSNLEKSLGVNLLIRTTRQLRLSDAGEGFYKRAQRIVEEMQAAQFETMKSIEAPMGDLRISAPLGMASTQLSTYIADFADKNPSVNVKIIFSDQKVDLIGEKFDLAIRIGPIESSSYKAKKIGTTKYFVVASPAFLDGKKMNWHPRDLAQHRCLLFGDSTETIWLLENTAGLRFKAKLRSNLCTNNISALLQLTLNGFGLAFLPASWVAELITKKRLVPVLPGWTGKHNPIHVIYPAQSFASSKISRILPYLTEAAKSL